MATLAVILAALLAAGIFLYNRLIRSRNRVDTAWSDIDVQLQRRHDLVPRLVSAVRQYAAWERSPW
jgi:LemA protein